MAENDTALREVDRALAEDQQASALRKNLPLLIGAAALVVAGVGGWRYWRHHQQTQAAENAAAYRAASEKLAAGDEQGIEGLQTLADESGGYATIAKFRLAAISADKGDRDKALALYREIYESGAPKRVKDLARLRAGYLSFGDGREAVINDIGPLESDESSLGFYAREALALAAMKAGDYQVAEEMFRNAARASAAPEPVRLRAQEFAALAGAGKAGVELPKIEATTQSDVDLYLESLKEAGSDLGAVLDGDGAGPAPPASDPRTDSEADPQ